MLDKILRLDIQSIISITTACIAVAALMWAAFIQWKLSRIMRGSNVARIDDAIIQMAKEIDDLTKHHEGTSEKIIHLTKQVAQSIRGSSVIRFNPFKGTGSGGNQSFSAAFVNEHGDGMVVSSLYSRDRVSIFSKALTHFESDFELTQEEREAIQKAKDYMISPK